MRVLRSSLIDLCCYSFIHFFDWFMSLCIYAFPDLVICLLSYEFHFTNIGSLIVSSICFVTYLKYLIHEFIDVFIAWFIYLFHWLIWRFLCLCSSSHISIFTHICVDIYVYVYVYVSIQYILLDIRCLFFAYLFLRLCLLT